MNLNLNLRKLPTPLARTTPIADAAGAVVRVPTATLRTADSPRTVGLDEEYARTLATAEGPYRPLLVHRATMRVIDGTHRLRAARLRGQHTVDVVFFDGSAEDAFVLSVEANIRHGRPLTRRERTTAALRILRTHPDWSDRFLADRTGLSARTVAALRVRATGPTAVDGRIGRDGRIRPLDPARGREAAARLLADHPQASLREIARAAGIAPSTVRDVRRRIGEGADPVPAGQRRARPPLHDASGGLSGVPGGSGGSGGPGSTGRATGSSSTSDGGAGQRLAALVPALCKDPLLRLSEAGRLLLRMLDLQVSALRQRERIVAAVPPYRAETAAAAAAQCAQVWQELSDELRRRGSAESSA
ncbi:ParB N-terminal domain-containing protein [Streptomyces sp. R302]|uniref:ParB/RepB/Spo0J family partition protein n=1 Tax=unclassified Streptomyces TaxID=2593676 RepID=UPI00145EB417|nr:MULTISPECIES: ParB N-terminal domain-containing protein [unclassified Streptomyces]NML54826.1 ParB N-terminal domain-containing protein [Streptomyces sp. R301]NML83513.1 ParB N-terminal domain-containing protein [Streptomyces sp. R302]